jgi:hypothetical protein
MAVSKFVHKQSDKLEQQQQHLSIQQLYWLLFAASKEKYN